MSHIFDYDLKYNGPALPIVELVIYRAGNNRNGASVPRVVVDSGADASMLPLRVLEQAGAQKVDWMRIRGVHGPSYIVEIYEVDVKVGDYTIFSVYVAADHFNRESIVGRDVLNQLVVTLNGLEGVVEIFGP